MAFQTNVLRNGEWVTQTVDVEAVLKPKTPSKDPRKEPILKPPCCGILSQTVVDSQIINFILPVRLRSALHKDIAFIGDRSVEIRELQEDGQLHHVTKKTDFGSRIRNARVLGSNYFPANPGLYHDQAMRKKEKFGPNNLVSYFGSSPSESLDVASEFPPQMLLLVLESGDCVFLLAKQKADGDGAGSGAGRPEMVATRFQNPKTGFVYPGFHLAVDPSSRYMALACTENFFAVYELESHETLAERHMRNEPLTPIRSFRGRSLPGVIHKIEFLYPKPGDPTHVILILIVARGGKSRLVTYEWELGDNLAAVLAEPKTGHRVPTEHRTPILLIPLCFQSTFISVSEHQIAVCKDVLHSPHYERFDTPTYEATDCYCGRDQPLWSAWARPLRLYNFYKTNDCIYLAREDGIVVYVEADTEGSLTSIASVGSFKGRISTAFACMDDQFNDVFIIGGDSGPGSIWQAPPRQPSRLVSAIPNLWPTADFATTDEFVTWNQKIGAKGSQMEGWEEGRSRKPDRVFATSGRGPQGCITEYRNGLQANILLDMDYDATVRQAWVFRVNPSDTFQGFYLLLSMPDRSDVLLLSLDLTEAIKPDLDAAPFDLSSRTLAARQARDGSIVQVTEQSITVFSGEKSIAFSYQQMLPMISGGSFLVSDASIFEDWIAVSTYTGSQFHVHVFELDRVRFGLSHKRGFDLIDGEVTCLSLGSGHRLFLGILRGGRPLLARCALDDATELQTIDLRNNLTLNRNPVAAGDDPFMGMEAISSIAASSGLMVLGTRSGQVITMTESDTPTIGIKEFGVTAANITSARVSDDGEQALFVCCDSGLFLLTGQDSGGRNITSFRAQHRVWPIDATEAPGPSPNIDYAVAVDMPSENPASTPILLVSGQQIMLAELLHRPGLVPRQMPVEGTPTKILYSHYLDCLVVAIERNGAPSLVFLDPDTGKDLGRPTDKGKQPVDQISGLDKPNDKIFGLCEWHYRNSVAVWHYILVSTRTGRVVVISAKKIKEPDGSHLISFKMQHKVKESYGPIYSVLGLDNGIVYCAGDTLHWKKMDPDTKKLVTADSFELGSPAVSLSMVNGKLVALTIRDSIEIIEPPREVGKTRGAGMTPEVGAGTDTGAANPVREAVSGVPAGGATEADTDRLRHADSRFKTAVHMVEVAGAQPEQALASIILVSDRECQVAGLWVPWQLPGQDCETLFEIELPSSIRSFRRGRTRPILGQQQHSPRYGRMISTLDDAEILGMSLDGSLRHFTLLSLEAWRFLRFVQNNAARSEEMCLLTFDSSECDGEDDTFDPEPRLGRGSEMHVDGDMLRRVVEKRALDRLLTSSAITGRMVELLDGLDGGIHTAPFEGEKARYIDLAYAIMEYFLEPVL